MTDDLLPYYHEELEFIRKMGDEFARANPKIAGRLRMDRGSSEDPHVSRLIEAFAYLNARTRHKIDDEFPEITDSVLNVLYPHYLAPFPSAAIVQMSLDRTQSELTSGYTIERGTRVETEPIQGQPCRFRTCYPVTLWPIEITSASFRGHPLPAPETRFTADAQAVLRLQFQCHSDKVCFRQLAMDSVRLYLHGSDQYVYDLYEVLLNDTIGIALTAGQGKAPPIELNKNCIQPVGFEREEGLLDYPARSFLGYRLLSEYFAFPEKFLFADIGGWTPEAWQQVGSESQLEMFVFLRRHVQDLERNLSRDTLQMGCCPIINLFQQRAEPIRLTHSTTQYRVVPDARRPLAHEIYSVNRVVAINPDNEEKEFLPFYSIRHGRQTDQPHPYWYASRRPAGGDADPGTEVFLSFVDLDMQPAAPAQWTVDVETTCLSRDLPRQLSFGGGQPVLQLATGGALAKVSCLTRPTETFRPPLRQGAMWRLISHLTLNHLSLSDENDAADALREILKLYDRSDSSETRAMIEGILSVRSRRVVGRVGGEVAAGFCRGLEVTVHLDTDRFAGSGVFLFASVLERFLGLYSSINSFTTTVATTNKHDGALRRWAPRAGERVLV